MKGVWPKSTKTLSHSRTISVEPSKQEKMKSKPESVKHEVLLRAPMCRVYLMDEGEALELANGDFTVLRLSDGNVFLSLVVKIGELQWPLTKDEPVVKLDEKNYLFSLPMKDGDPLSYGVTFLDGGNLVLLDSFLREHTCFSCSCSSNQRKDLNWKEFAPRIEDYNNFLAKAIAEGTGQIVKGIFTISNGYSNQVQKQGQMILKEGNVKKKNGLLDYKGADTSKKNKVNESMKRVRKLSMLTETMSKSMLDRVGIASASVMAPAVRSQAGQAFLAMVPGEVLLASLDAVNRVLDAAEAAEKQALLATSATATRMVSERFGDSAGEATGDVLATTGHCANTAWNVFKIRKALTPSPSVSSGVLKNTRSIKKS
ncbi:hypothetical protein NMG60_11021922 [Bertholletia excelsa]